MASMVLLDSTLVESLTPNVNVPLLLWCITLAVKSVLNENLGGVLGGTQCF